MASHSSPIEGAGDPLEDFPVEAPEIRPAYPSGFPLQVQDPWEEAYRADIAARQPSVVGRVAAVLVLVGVFAGGISIGTWAWRRQPTVSPVAVAQTAVNKTVPPVPEVRETQPDPVRAPAPAPALSIVPAPVPASVAPSAATLTKPDVPGKARPDELPAPTRAASRPPTESRRIDPPISRETVEFAPLLAPIAPPVQEVFREPDAVAATLAQPSAPVVPATVVATAATNQPVAAAVAQPRVDEDGAVRATLGRYRDAYQRLDAAAAKQVWPGVDERALSRAFSNLASQSITFDDCKTTVSGAAASASCRGTATYIGRLGSRNTLTERREWTFKLQKAGNAWQVQSVQVR